MTVKEALRKRKQEIAHELRVYNPDTITMYAPMEILARCLMCGWLLDDMSEDTPEALLNAYDRIRGSEACTIIVRVLTDAGYSDLAKTFAASCELIK